MRRTLVLILVGGSLAGTGCSLVSSTAHNLAGEVRLCLTDVRLTRRANELAEEAWAEVVSSSPGAYPPDYAGGFRCGFTDALRGGGPGEPPPVPPPPYWAARYQTPEGHAAIRDWFEGYRHGALVAAQSEHMKYSTVPTSVRPPGGGVPPHAGPPPPPLAAPPGLPRAVAPPAADDPVLPPPRRVAPPEGIEPQRNP